MSSISDALKRAEQERERLRAPTSDAGAAGSQEHPEASLASVVLRKTPPISREEAASTIATPPASSPITPLADAMRNAPQTPPPAIRAQQQAAETIVEDYTSKRRLNLPHSMVVYHERAGKAAAQYRKIRDALMAANSKRDHQILVITSAAPREGKTVTVMNLGLSLAEIRANRVLLVDGVLHSDAGANSLTDLLKLRGEPGLAELLMDANDGSDAGEPIQNSIKATPWHNLFILPSGARTTPTAAAQLLQSQSVRTLFRQLRATFDWILVDSPPAFALPDAGLLSGPSDGILLAVALHHTPQAKIQTTIRRLRSMNLPLKSCILTRA